MITGSSFAEKNMKFEANVPGAELRPHDKRLPPKPRRAELEAALEKRGVKFEPNTPMGDLIALSAKKEKKRGA